MAAQKSKPTQAQSQANIRPETEETEEEELPEGTDDAEATAAEPIDVDEVVPPPRAGALTPLRDPVQRFLSEARRFQRLSDEEERVLGRAVREQGDMGAARKLVVHNLRLVISIAYHYRRAW